MSSAEQDYTRRLAALMLPTQGELDLLARMAAEAHRSATKQPDPIQTRKPNKWDRRRLRQGMQTSLERSDSVLSKKARAKAMAFRVVQEGSR